MTAIATMREKSVKGITMRLTSSDVGYSGIFATNPQKMAIRLDRLNYVARRS
jgi:hypothetical protein